MTGATAVVGGGVAGLSLAYALARRGRSVTLLEAQSFGAGASGAPFALLNPHRGRSARASALDMAGLAATRRLGAELRAAGLESGLHFSSVLRIPTDVRQARGWQQRSAEQEGARWLAPEAVPSPYRAPHGALLVAAGGWLEPHRLLASLAAAARALGATLLEQRPVRALTPTAAGYALDTPQGTLHADTVVLCVGASELAGAHLPAWERVAGDIVGLASGPALPYPLAGGVYGGTIGDTLYVGGNHRDPATPDPDAPARLLQRFGAFLSGPLPDAPFTHWRGVRARTPDNAPTFEEVAPRLWVFGGLSGRGFLCAFHLAERWAAEP